MRNLSAVLFVALAACGGGSDTPPADTAPPQDTAPPPDTDPPPPDSQVLDTSCMANQTAPTTATATVTASGAANRLDVNGIMPDVQPLPDAAVDVCLNDCQGGNNLLDSTNSAAAPCGSAGCDFTTAAIDTPNDMPLNAYLKVAKDGVITSNIFPSEPIRADLMNVPALALTPNAFSFLASLGGGHTKGNGALVVVVTDCALTPAQSATLTVTRNGNPAGNTPVDVGQFVPELAGTFFVFNVPPGTTTVGATVNGTTFRVHDIEAFADELSATQVTPGFAAP